MHKRYLAPLNYDRFFKKVFSDITIAKQFLEDFLGVKIEEIELLPTDYKITDGAVSVKFDYRCKIDGQFVVIDMQQWYTTDIVKRFFIYFAANSVLQLEKIPVKSIEIGASKKQETYNYDTIEPAITLIWLVNDTLNFEDDYIAFSIFPEQIVDFLKNDSLWHKGDLVSLEQERKKVLAILNNNTKDLDFLPKNRLIYILQKNITKNKRYSKYFEWFDFAEKTRNPNNKKEDFVKFEKNKTIMSAINRLKIRALEPEESQELTAIERLEVMAALHRDAITREVRAEVKAEVKAEAQQENVIKFWKKGIDLTMISNLMDMPIEQIERIINEYRKKL